MVLKILIGCLIATTLAIPACSDDDASKKNSAPSSALPSKVSNDSPPIKQTTKPNTNGHNKTRSGEALVQTSFAGFGRVGRSQYSDVAYRARWAVIVGLNRFKHMNNLDNAVNDASAIRDMLRDEFGYEEARIIFLADQAKDARRKLVDKRLVNKAELLQAFDDLESRDIRANDAVFFFFAGHGKSDNNGTYLAAYDSVSEDTSTWIDVGQLKDRFERLPARHKLIVLDSCYAGSILDVDLSKERKPRPRTASSKTPPPSSPSAQRVSQRSDGDEAMELRDNLAYYLQEPAFLALTSGRDQPVGDVSQAKPDHSPFTSSLLQVLRERANSVRPGDVFTAREMAVRVESLVRKGQTPDWGRLGGGRGDFVFKPTFDRLTPREWAERDDYGLKIAFADILIKKRNQERVARIERKDNGNLFMDILTLGPTQNEARKLLDRCQDSLRGCEWHQLRRRMDMSLRTISASTFVHGERSTLLKDDFDRLKTGLAEFTSVHRVAFSPDGKWIAGVGKKNEWDEAGKLQDKHVVHVWDRQLIAGQGVKPMLTLGGHTNTITAIDFSGDGKKIISASWDKHFKMWDIEQGGKPLASMPTSHSKVTDIAFSPTDSRFVTTGWEGDVTLWNPITRDIKTLKGKGGSSVTFDAKGERIAACSRDGVINVWDSLGDGQPLLTWRGHGMNDVRSIAFSPDGTRIVSGSDDKTVKVWDVQDGGKLLRNLKGHDGIVWSVAFSPDGKRIASAGSDETIKVWDTTLGNEPQMTLLGHDSVVYSVAFSPDGKQLVSGSGDGTIKLWNAEPTTLLPSDYAKFKAIAFSDDGEYLVTSGNRTVAEKNEGVVNVWDASKGNKPLVTISGLSEMTGVVAFSADGSRIAASGQVTVAGKQEGVIHVWDATRGGQPLITIRDSEAGFVGLAFSPDGKRIASVAHRDGSSGAKDRPLFGKPEGIITVWNAERVGEPLVRIHLTEGALFSVAFSPDGARLASGSTDGNVRIWDAERGGEPLAVLTGHLGWVVTVAFSKDGNRVVSGSWDKSICVWNAKRGGRPVAIMRGHASIVHSVAFTSDGRRIVSASEDGTVKVWDAERYDTAMLNLVEQDGRKFQGMAITDNAKRGVAVDANGGLFFWDNN